MWLLALVAGPALAEPMLEIPDTVRQGALIIGRTNPGVRVIVDGQPVGPMAVGGFSSDHPGGANFAMGDGSVRFITETIAAEVYQQLGHRADGKLLDF